MSPYFAGPYDYTADPIDFLLAPYLLGADWYEQGFQSMYEFVTMTPEGAGFFREDADKLIIFVSDETNKAHFPTMSFMIGL